MTSISFKVDDEIKKKVGQLAKSQRMTVTKFMNQILNKALEKGELAASLYENDEDFARETIRILKHEGKHKQDGRVDVELDSSDKLIYTPEAWVLNIKEAEKKINVPENVLKRLVLRNYLLITENDPLLEKSKKTLNMHAVKKLDTNAEVLNKVFGTDIKEPLIMVEKLDPLKLGRFCKDHIDQKVIYILHNEEPKTNR